MIAKEIHDSLICTKGVSLFGAGYVMPGETHIDFNYTDYAYIQALGQDDVLPALNEILAKFAIDVIFLAHDDWIYRLKDNAIISKSVVCKHPPETIDLLSFKSRTYAKLGHLGFMPIVYDSIETADKYPFIMKPDRGQGSKGVLRIDSEKQLKTVLQLGIDLSEMVFSEFLPGEENTIDCFTDQHGVLIFASSRIRSVIHNGLASTTQISIKPYLIELANKLNSELRFTGAWFFQTKNDYYGDPKLLEIGGRLAGASGVQRALGVNMSELWFYMTNGQTIGITKNDLTPRREVGNPSRLFLGQSFDQIFVDYDDCLFLNGSINDSLVNFLKIEKSNGKEIFLISRHKGNLREEVKRLEIENLFTGIHHILDGSRKSAFFSKSKSILFIDDSYSERKDLKDHSNVKTVDASIFTDSVYLGL